MSLVSKSQNQPATHTSPCPRSGLRVGIALLALVNVGSAWAEPQLGRYCSMTWPTGGWSLAWYANLTDDPCAHIKKNSDPGGTVQRAGLWSVAGVNNVVARCGTDAGWVQLGAAPGDKPFSFTHKLAADAKQKHCVFTAAPREMPIFKSPYPVSTKVSPGTGFDFARGKAFILNVAKEFGGAGEVSGATKVDWKGRDKSAIAYIDDHDGWDINMPTGTKMLAVAGGKVLEARFRDTADCKTKSQGEIFIQHTASGGKGTQQYDEQFVSFYAHVSKISVKKGDTVTQGQQIGLSGDTGCSSGPHLHFGAFRISNAASYYRFPIQINTDFSPGKDQNSANLWQVPTEPHGFYPKAGFDPWAWKSYPLGALSVMLWESGQAPATGDW